MCSTVILKTPSIFFVEFIYIYIYVNVIYFSDRTVKIAPSCDEVQFLPVQWSPTDFEGVSIEPNYVPWTEVTILGVISTTMVSGKTESSGDVPS